MKTPNHDIHAVSGLQQPAAVRERHPIGLSGFELVGSLASLFSTVAVRIPTNCCKGLAMLIAPEGTCAIEPAIDALLASSA